MSATRNLVIGSAGFVGRYLCDYLRQKGEEVITYDIVDNLKQDARYNILPINTYNIDRVYLLAWKVGGSKYLYDKDTQKEQLEWNLPLLSNVFKQLSIKDAPKFVFVSSQLAEDNNTVYGVLKRLGEVMTSLTTNGVSVRLWNVYGAFEKASVKSHVVADFVHQALENNRIEMMTDGSEKRQFIHVEDVCDALYESFNHIGSGPYDVSSFKDNMIYDVALAVEKYTGCKIFEHYKKGSALAIKNITKIPEWEPNISLDEGIR